MSCASCPLGHGEGLSERPQPALADLLHQLSECDDCPLTHGHACSAAEGAELVRLLRDAAQQHRQDLRALKKAANTIRELGESSRKANERVDKLEAMQKESMRQADSELSAKMEQLTRQQAAIMEMSTPTIEVMDGVLVLPIIGTLDDARARILSDTLLGEIIRVRARYAILDLTGVSALDGRTARILSAIASAVRLLGARVMLTGIRPQVAQELIALGEDIAQLQTARTLKDALRQTGLRK